MTETKPVETKPVAAKGTPKMYRMLYNWRCGKYYPEGSTSTLAEVEPSVIDDAIASGYIEEV
jgi:hypothetical protein